MPYSTSAINLGDLARAFAELKPTNEASRLAIASTLGMFWDPPKPTKVAVKPRPTHQRETLYERPSQHDIERLPTPPRVITSRLDHTRSEDAAPSILVPPLEASAAESDSQSPLHEPLFFPRWTRAILSAGLATNSEIGEIDIDRVVNILAKGHCLNKLPLLSTPTLTRGVQLLIDRSQAMTPFIQDQIRLHREILATVGSDRVTTLRFVGCPIRGAGAGSEPTWAPYEPPPTRAPILLLSDLGIGRPRLSDERAGIREWLTFIRLVKKAKCPLLAFVPYEASRWPLALANQMSIIQWDRNTTAITVCNKLKHARVVVG